MTLLVVLAYPSDSASAKTSSPSSPAPDSVVVDKLPVDVVTIGTDWEACSEASAAVLSVKTVTVKNKNRKPIKVESHFVFYNLSLLIY